MYNNLSVSLESSGALVLDGGSLELECIGDDEMFACEWCVWSRWEKDPKGNPVKWSQAGNASGNWRTFEDDDCEPDGDSELIFLRTDVSNQTLDSSHVDVNANNYRYHIVVGVGQCPDPDTMWDTYDTSGVLPMGGGEFVEEY